MARRAFGKIRQLPSKRYQASFIGPDGVRYVGPITWEAKIDAEGWLADERRYLEREGEQGWLAPADRNAAARREASTVTLREYSKTWLKRPGIRDTTREKYGQALRLRVLDFRGRPALGDAVIAKLTKAQVAEWWRGLDHKEHGRACDLAYQALRAMLNGAIDEEIIAVNPCAVRGAGGAAKRRAITPLTPAQVQACADAMPAPWRIGVLLAAWTSLRSGEIRALRRGDVHLAGKEPRIEVRRGVVRVEGRLRYGDTKTDAGSRDVVIPPPLVDELRRHLSTHAQVGPAGLLIWSEETGGAVHDGSWGRAWRRAADSAGIPDGFHFHDLRHTGLTYAAIAGATIRELQQLAGHTTPAAAMRYQEVASGRMGELAERLGKMMQAGA